MAAAHLCPRGGGCCRRCCWDRMKGSTTAAGARTRTLHTGRPAAATASAGAPAERSGEAGGRRVGGRGGDRLLRGSDGRRPGGVQAPCPSLQLALGRMVCCHGLPCRCPGRSSTGCCRAALPLSAPASSSLLLPIGVDGRQAVRQLAACLPPPRSSARQWLRRWPGC